MEQGVVEKTAALGSSKDDNSDKRLEHQASDNTFDGNGIPEINCQVLKTLHLPPWALEENNNNNNKDCQEEEEEEEPRTSLPQTTTDNNKSCLLENFSQDISALILSHLDLQEIANASLVSKSFYRFCRSNTLWKYLMSYRWNINNNPDHQEQVLPNYFDAYQQAHAHPHDLWISHWNCVYPNEGLAPGRCFISSSNAPNKSPRVKTRSSHAHSTAACWEVCPNCRNWNEFDACNKDHVVVPTTLAQFMALATSYTRHKICSHQPVVRLLDDWHHSETTQARQAFDCAGTFHRKLSTRQFQAGLGFLTDLVFFNLTDPTTEQGQWELEQLLKAPPQDDESDDDDEQDTTTTSDPLYETSHHSWHVCRLFNPDFYRPIIYQIGIERPECFTVYPSEGYIEPGGTIYLTVGVRPLGSALAHAFEALNVQRDGLDVAWADLYTEQAHLPMAPILIRYQFAMTSPSRPVHDPRRRPPYADSTRPRYSSSEQSQQAALDYHWRQPMAAHQIRNIHLSVHVHSYYSFADFLQATCHPWHVAARRSNDDGPIFVAPVLSEMYPAVYEKLQDVPLERPTGIILSRTEGPCQDCGRSWGVREEELAQAYIVCQIEIAQHFEKRRVLLDNIVKCVGLLGSGLSGQASKLSTLLVTVNHVLQCLKASPWASLQQKRALLQLEAIFDDAYREIPVGGEKWIPWRLSGVYRYAVCTHSVFDGPLLQDDGIEADFKDEPDYLDAFRHLAHSPGRYCLGPQEDPNHLEETVVKASPRYARIQKGIVTDVFMDDPISAFQAGICMMRDPRSLLVHGIYDRIPAPGAVVRRPKIHNLEPTVKQRRRPWLPVLTSENLLQSIEARRKFMFLQNGLDLEAIFSVERCLGVGDEKARSGSSLERFSLENYLRGVPPPGVGRFALSQEVAVDAEGAAGSSSRIVALELEDEGEGADGRTSGVERGLTAIDRQVRPHRAPMGGNVRGPRLLHLLWILGAQLGLAVTADSPDVASVFVDRTILIASQWVSISLMLAPLFWTLCARYAQLIPAQPIDYNLENLPFSISNKMRFLSERECGYVAVLVLLMWLALGRWTERHVNRDFFRVMLEHITPHQGRGEKMQRVRRFGAGIFLWFQRQWDAFCPLFLQRRVFAPHWNRRSTDDLMRHIAFWRSRNLGQWSVARPAERRGDRLFGDSRDEGIDVGSVCSSTKLAVGALVALGSFCSSSPHFWLNLVTVFSCSISLGMSVSLHSMEKGNSSLNMHSTGSMIKAASLATVVILSFLVGQLVGSSGGTMFLAEFIVTSISLILGGAGTISASAMESWGCFFCLSTTAFWGYLFGRVALMDGIRQKRGGYSSILLSKAVIFLFFFWVLVFLISTWDGPVSIMIRRRSSPKDMRIPNGKFARDLLQ